MGKIIIVSFRPSRLPRRRLSDGWWLETPPTHRPVIAFPKRHTKPNSQPKPQPKPWVRHLTLVTSRK